jgi:hypothetical protein
MSQGTNPTYNGEGKTALLNMIHSAPNKAELTGYKPHITGVLTSGNAADDSFLRNHLGRVYYSSLHYAGLDNLITDAVDSSFRTISMTPTGLYEGTASAAGNANLKLLLHFDGSDGATTTTDSTTNSHTVTFHNGTQISTTQSKFGGSSAKFDGSNDYAKVLNSADFNFGSSDFTIEFWMYATDIMAGYHQDIIGNQIGGGFRVVFSSKGSWEDGLGLRTNLGNVQAGSTSGWTNNIWHHVAVVRNGTAINIYRNGVSNATATWSGAITDTTQNIIVGMDSRSEPPTDYPFNGYIDELRITKGEARYTSNFTPPTSAFLSTE